MSSKVDVGGFIVRELSVGVGIGMILARCLQSRLLEALTYVNSTVVLAQMSHVLELRLLAAELQMQRKYQTSQH